MPASRPGRQAVREGVSSPVSVSQQQAQHYCIDETTTSPELVNGRGVARCEPAQRRGLARVLGRRRGQRAGRPAARGGLRRARRPARRGGTEDAGERQANQLCSGASRPSRSRRARRPPRWSASSRLYRTGRRSLRLSAARGTPPTRLRPRPAMARRPTRAPASPTLATTTSRRSSGVVMCYGSCARWPAASPCSRSANGTPGGGTAG